ncbi:uncharacterized protein [Ptychodera flava]|uniref:uncharacterized protein n=1 Tax=Ptychodera flava TaxID=63121 RepID=UPI00396A5A96
MATRDVKLITGSQPSLSVVGGKPVSVRPKRIPHQLYRPTSEYVEDNKDSGREDIAALLSRLQTESLTPQERENLRRPKRLMNIKCSCGDLSNLTRQAKLELEDISESDSDSEESDFGIAELLRTLTAYCHKGIKVGSVLRNLAESYSQDEEITDAQLKQVMELFGSGSMSVKEATMILMKQLACNPSNAEKMLNRNLIYHLVTLLERPDMRTLTVHALLTVEKLLIPQHQSDIWLEFMVVRGLSTLLNVLSHNNAESVRLASLSVFRALAANSKIAVLIIDQCMEHIMDFALHSDRAREIICGLLANLAAHNDHFIANVLDWDALPIVIAILTQGTCGAQMQAMRFLTKLSDCEYGQSVLLEEHMVPFIMYAMAESNCREVREAACRTVRNILSIKKVPQLRDFMLQIQKTEEKKDRGNGDLDRTTLDTETLLRLGIGKKEISEKVEKGLSALVETLVRVLKREAKIDADRKTGKVLSVGFRPCQDRYHTVALVVDCLTCLVTLPLNRQKSRTHVNGGGDTDTGSKFMSQRVNPVTLNILIRKGALCVIDLLFAYTRRLTGSNEPVPRTENNIDVLHLQALLNAWEKQDKSAVQNSAFIFEPAELKFIQRILDFVEIVVKSCSQLVHAELEDKILERIRDSETKTPDDVDEESSVIPGEDDDDSDTRKVRWCDPVQTAGLRQAPAHTASTGVPRQSGSSYGQIKSGKTAQRKRPSSGRRKLYRSHDTEGGEPAKQNNEEQSRVSAAERLDKEMMEFRKHLKLALVKEGIVESVGPWLYSEVVGIRNSVLEIMRHTIQPLQGSDYGMKTINPFNKRPVSAKSIAERDQALQRALSQMTDQTAGVIKDALGPNKRTRPMSAPMKTKGKTAEHFQPSAWKPVIEFDHPLSWQCCLAVLDICGKGLLDGLSSQFCDLKKESLMLLHDAALFGETTVHMKLSALGCIPKLIEFLRLNDGDELLVVLGVVTLRSLVTSDNRLKQLFVKHGGADLLMAMSGWSKGVIKEEVALTLKCITRSY